MIPILSIFSSKAKRGKTAPSIAFKGALTGSNLFDFIRACREPAQIDRALREVSKSAFWPQDGAMISFYAEAKKDPELDARLLKAAACSAEERRAALDPAAPPDRHGAFAHYVYADPEDPMQSMIFKVVRSGATGGGTGAWGGLCEDDDADREAALNRETDEELADALQLLGAPESLSQADRDAVASLTADLREARKARLFSCRDDAHVINRGWGHRVEAHAHAALITAATAQKFKALKEKIDKAQRRKSAIMGETAGIAVYTAAQAPEKMKLSHYGHEAFAEMLAFGRAIHAGAGNRGLREFWHACEESGAVRDCAKRMNVRLADMQKLYETVTRDEKAQAMRLAPKPAPGQGTAARSTFNHQQ